MGVRDTIQEKLAAAFSPQLLDVADDSARHAGHAGARTKDGDAGETHFRVKIISCAFETLSRVERQRQIHAVLAEELATRVHALSLCALTPAEASLLSPGARSAAP